MIQAPNPRMKLTKNQITFLGIDVAKNSFQVALKAGDHFSQNSFKNSVSGFKKLRKWLSQLAPGNQIHACLEATGIHHIALALELHSYLKTVSVVNPRCPKAFADSQLRRCKSDSVDARVIADFCEAMKPEAWVAPTEKELEIKELARRQKNLTGMIAAEKNRLQDALSRSLEQSIRRAIKLLEKEQQKVAETLASLIGGDPVLRSRLELVVSIPGIGEATGLQLVAELGSIDWFKKARHLAAYTGVTPRHRQSGTSLHSRGGISKVGSSRLRGLLYFPAMVAMRHNPIMIAFAARLREAGKSEKEIIVAVMRKLIHCVFGVLKNQQPFNPKITCSI